jgi:hypothetical protein
MTEKFGIDLGPDYGKVIHGEASPQEEHPPAGGGGGTREEKIAAFRARREELKQRTEELERKGGKKFDEEYKSAGTESYDRSMAEHYDFDIKKIDEAIEEAKKVNKQTYRELSIERLQGAKALIEKEIGVEQPKENFIFTTPFSEDIRKETEEGERVEIPPEPKAEEKEETPPEQEQSPLAGGITPETQRAFEELLGKKSEEQQEETKTQEAQPEPKPTEQPPAAAAAAAEGERPPAGEESPEMKKAVDELLGGEMAGNERVREAARGVVKAREKSEKDYQEASERLFSIFVAEKRAAHAGKSEQEISSKLKEYGSTLFQNVYLPEHKRYLALQEQHVPPEKAGLFKKINYYYNHPFTPWGALEKRGYKNAARTARILIGAGIMTGVAFNAGLVAGGGALAFYAGKRVGFPLLAWGVNHLAINKVDNKLARWTEKEKIKLQDVHGKKFEKTLEQIKRTEDLFAFFKEEAARTIKGYESIERRRKFYKGATMAGIVALNVAAGYGLARVSDIGGLPEGDIMKPHVAIEEESLRTRIEKAWESITKGRGEYGPSTGEAAGDLKGAEEAARAAGKSASGFVGPEIMDRAKELAASGRSQAESMVRALEEAAADMQARGKLGIPGLWEVDRPKGVGGGVVHEAETLPPAAEGAPKTSGPSILYEGPEPPPETIPRSGAGKGLARPLEAGTGMPGPSKEDIANLGKIVEGADRAAEKIGVIPKGGSIWETAMDMKRREIMTAEQLNEAWEKSTATINGKEVPLRDVWLVHKEDSLQFVETPEGPRLQLIDAKDAFKAGTYKELGDAYDALGKEQPASLKAAIAHEQHLPTAAEQLKNLVDTKTVRPAIDQSAIEAIKDAPTAEGKSLSAALENPQNYIKWFEKASLLDQEAEIEQWKKTLENIHAGAPMEDPAVAGLAAKAEGLVKQLENNEAYLQHVKVWETFRHAWEVEGGFRGEKAHLFDEMLKKWTVQDFVDTNRKLIRGVFEPRLGDPIGQHIEIHRNGFLGLSQDVMQDIAEKKPSPHTNLGRFLKNVL